MLYFNRTEESFQPERRRRAAMPVASRIRAVVYTATGTERPSMEALKCFFQTHRLCVMDRKGVGGIWYKLTKKGMSGPVTTAVKRKGMFIIY